MYLIIDNYDSFTYNIYQYVKELTDKEVRVIRNDVMRVQDAEKLDPEGIIISPGPGRPEQAGISVEIIRTFAGRIPILGVCLGHQAIAAAFGGTIVQAKRIVHGKAEDIRHDGKGLFRTLPSPSVFTRYHSLVVEEASLPEELEITARSLDGEIMGIRHRKYDIEGIQFHPESIASEFGRKVMSNFLRYKREPFRVTEMLVKVINGGNLSQESSEGFMHELTDGNLTESQTAAYLVALNGKGITAEEIAGCARVLKEKCTPLTGIPSPVLDTCGTGGDGLGTFNISSLAALTAAACGARVAKHGNRAISSQSGSADFYRELGIPVDITPDQSVKLLDKTGFAFLYAPIYHSAMRHAAKVRRDLRIKTIMNLLGPLVNPAGAEYQMIGVFDEKFCLPVAEAAHFLGIKRALVVHGSDGLDEISVTAPTKIVSVDHEGNMEETEFDPAELGLPSYRLEELSGGTAAENAGIAETVLAGTGFPAVRDAVLVNTGAALYVLGMAESIKAGFDTARDALALGKVTEKIEQIRKEAESL